MKPLASLLLLFAAATILSGCLGRNRNAALPEESAGVVEEQPSTVPENAFLYTGYEPLERWMEERFKVRYENMPLDMLFDQQPISDIRYQHVNLPEETPVFELVSPSISRREILREIARFYNLGMTVQMVDGKPGYVQVTQLQAAPAPAPGPAPAPAPAPGAATQPAPQQPAPAPAPNPAPKPAPAPAPAPGGVDVPIGNP